MRTLLLIVITAFTIVSCTKTENRKPITLAGYIYKKIDSTPYDNTSFIFYEKTDATITGKNAEENIVPFTTDEKGYFNVNFTRLHKGYGLSLRWPGSYDDRPIEYVDLRNSNTENLIFYVD